MRYLKPTLIIIAVVQLALGVVFLVPGLFASIMDLEAAPGWTDWLFAMFGARAIGFAYGMLVASRDPFGNITWIKAMIGVQAIDWIATISYLVAGTVTLSEVTTATFLPIIFIAILIQPLVHRNTQEDATTG